MSTPPRPRARRGEGAATRAQILDAALAEFARHGYAGATIRGITRAVGIRESAFYVYFDSKQAVYAALFLDVGPGVVEHAAAQLTPNDNPATALRAFVGAIMLTWEQPRAQAFASIMLRDAFVGDAAGGRMLLDWIARVIGLVAQPIAAWVQAGRMLPGVLPEHLAWELIAPLNVIRFLHFNAAATDADRQHGQARVEQHIAYFIARNVDEGFAKAKEHD